MLDAIDHLGLALSEVADMHPDHKCTALHKAVAFYLENSKDRPRYDVLAEDFSWGTWRQLRVTDIFDPDLNIENIERVLSKLTPEEQRLLGYDSNWKNWYQPLS